MLHPSLANQIEHNAYLQDRERQAKIAKLQQAASTAREARLDSLARPTMRTRLGRLGSALRLAHAQS